MVKKADSFENQLLEINNIVKKQAREIKNLKEKVKNLENDFKKVVNNKRVHCIQPFCNSTNIEFTGYDIDFMGLITLDKKYKCRECGFEWVEKKVSDTNTNATGLKFKSFKY